MKLVVAGINHRTAPVEIREKLSFGQREAAQANSFLKERFSFKEGLVLSTCNRIEVYAVDALSNYDPAGRIKGFLSECRKAKPAEFEKRLYVYEDKEATRHLFKVASGLDSMVLGEAEILGQVKNAYLDARRSRTTGKVLNRLFEKAFNTAKKIRSETGVSRGAVSASSVAVKFAAQILGNLPDKKVLVIGAGKVGGQLILHLKNKGVKSVFVTNRTFERVQELAASLGVCALKVENLHSALRDADIAITSTSAPHFIIKKSDILSVMPERKKRPLFIVDLAVPRDVEEGVKEIKNVHLYDIDDLQKAAEENLALRKNELTNCNRIIDNSCRAFMEWLAKEVKHEG